MGMFMDFCLGLSVCGCGLLVFLSFCCFSNMEALHLPKGKKNQRGVEVMVAALVTFNLLIIIFLNFSNNF